MMQFVFVVAASGSGLWDPRPETEGVFKIRFEEQDGALLSFDGREKRLHVGGPQPLDVSFPAAGGANVRFGNTELEVPKGMKPSHL